MILVELALPGASFIYNGAELGLPNVDLPDEALQDPVWERSGHAERGRDGCRVPLPWEGSEPRSDSPPVRAPGCRCHASGRHSRWRRRSRTSTRCSRFIAPPSNFVAPGRSSPAPTSIGTAVPRLPRFPSTRWSDLCSQHHGGADRTAERAATVEQRTTRRRSTTRQRCGVADLREHRTRHLNSYRATISGIEPPR